MGRDTSALRAALTANEDARYSQRTQCGHQKNPYTIQMNIGRLSFCLAKHTVCSLTKIYIECN